MSSPHIISGPAENYDIPKGSSGKYMFDCLRQRDPSEIITVDEVTGKVYTCGQLLEESVKFAVILKNLGIKKGDTIAIISENRLNYFVPVLSALYTGVIFNPINPAYLTGELKHAFRLSNPKLAICSELSVKSVLEAKEELEFLESVLLIGAGSDNHPELSNLEELITSVEVDVKDFTPQELDVEDDACILLSSGTTGWPKGVLLTHQNLQSIGYIRDPNYGNIVTGDVTLLVVPYFHVFGLLVQLASIAFSMKVVLMDKFKPDSFLQAIHDHKVTKLYLVPPLILFLAKSPLVDKYDLSNVKDILCGAAPLGKDVENEVSERLKNIRVRQMYGLTETGGACTFQTRRIKPGSAGVLVPGMVAKVCSSEAKSALGPLEVGELCFKGPMLMKGYVGNAAATKDSFDEDGFYHTGDVGYYDEDQCFYIVDRMKELIKYKGFQVAPAELEALIVTHPVVRDCGVIGIPDERAGQIPLAFVVKQNGVTVSEQDIVDYVASRISVQKRLYGGVIFVEDIPKNSSGKILRSELVEMYQKLH